MNGQQAWIFPASSISALKESISFTATRNQQGHVMNEAWNPGSPRHFCTPIIWGQILSSLQGRKTSWIERAGKSEKPHRQPSNCLCRALGTQLTPSGMGNASLVSAGRQKQPVGLQGRGVPTSLLRTPHISTAYLGERQLERVGK